MKSKLPFRNQVGEHQDNNNYEIKLATCNKIFSVDSIKNSYLSLEQKQQFVVA